VEFTVKNSSRSSLPSPPFFLLLVLFSLFALSLPAQNRAAAPELQSRSAVLLDAATGTLLYYKNPDEEISPASLTKLMTMHLAFKEIETGRASLDEITNPPPESWAVNQPYRSSLMFLASGQRVSLRELLLGLAVPSGNDAAVAVALRFAPSVSSFVAMMNREASDLGLVKTRFTEPSGVSETNMTTAREFALFCRAYLQAHPGALREYHSVYEFSYPEPENLAPVFHARPGTIVQYNRNTLLGKFEGVDGLKTGYIDEAGYNIALTAERGGTRFIAVIMGAPARPGGDRIRDADGRELLSWAFANYKTVRPLLGDLEPARIWKGKTDWVALAPGSPLEFTALTGRAEKLRWETESGAPLVAPLPEGSPAGTLVFYDDLGELRRVPLVTAAATEAGNIFKRALDSIRLFFRGEKKQ
jgi:D-alanyl-D-alanine carboxypeptidase (penicillin-binding protein 5/6)